MAVTKNHPISAVTECLEAGISLFGENRVQEAREKFGQSPESSSGGTDRSDRIGTVELHLIGHLQRNKAKLVPGLFSAVQSIDAERTLAALAKAVAPAGVGESEPARVSKEARIDVYVEVNTSREASKHGVTSEDELFRLVEAAATYGAFRVRGLMTIAPFTNDEALLRRSFRRLYHLRDEVNARFPEAGTTELSMGMTNDYRIAVEEGSTMLRIGTGLLGARTYALS
jgi:hypothetical protein